MNCDPNALMEAAKCFRCIPAGEQAAIQIYLLCQWANMPTGPVIYWVPNTRGCLWEDGSGVHVGADLADFLANADLDQVTRLQVASFSVTEIGNLNSLPSLSILELFDTEITSIDLSGNPALTHLYLHSTWLTSLDLRANINLQFLRCDNSLLETIDCSGLASLTILRCQMCELGTLTITGCTAITELWTYDNPQTPVNPPFVLIP